MKRILSLYSLIPILIAAGAANLHAQSIKVDKSSLTFSAQVGGAVTPAQTLAVSSSTGAATAFFWQSDASWVRVNGQSSAAATQNTTPATVNVTADPTGLVSGPYNATITFFNQINSVSVTVSFTVSPLGVSPTSLSFGPYTVGTVPAATQNITLSGSGNFTASLSACPWLSVSPTFGTAPGTIVATLNGSIVGGLAANTYQCPITITPAATNSPITVTATLAVLPTPQVTVSPNTATFNVQSIGSNNPGGQVLTISTSPAQQVNYFLFSASDPWITFFPVSGATDAATGTAQITIGYNTSALSVGKTYTGTLTLSTPLGTPTQTPITVVLNYSDKPYLNVSPTNLSFTTQFGSSPADKTITVSSTDSSQTATYAVAKSANADWLAVPNAGNTAAPFTVSVRSATLPPGTYTATITVTPSAAGSAPIQIPVTLTVSNDPSIATSVSAMSFPYQLGVGQTVAPQNLSVSSTTGVTLNYTAVPSTSSCGSGWLLLNGSPSQISSTTASQNPIVVNIATAGLVAGTCSGSITISGSNPATGAAVPAVVVPITVVVSNAPLLLATPPTRSFTTALGSSPAQQTITLSSTSPADALSCSITDISASVNGITWLGAFLTSGTSCNNSLNLSVVSNNLAAGKYNGTVTIVAKASGGANTANSPFVIPVSLTVTSGALSLSTSSLSFQYTVGGQAPASQTVVVSSTQPLSYSAAVANPSQTPWLSVSPTSGTTSGTTTASSTLTVAIDATKLTTAQTYTGAITVSSPNAANSPATINVTVTVAPGTISSPATTLTFNQVAGGPAPAAQTIAVNGSPGVLNYTVATSPSTPWLTVGAASGSTPGSIQVSASAGSLAIGTYNGSVIITSTGASGSPITVPVVLNVLAAQTLSANPSAMTFAYTIGQPAPATQSLSITSSGSAAAITVQVDQSSAPAAFLQVTPTTSTAPATLTVTVTPGSLPPGVYNAQITVSSPSALNALKIPVTFTVVQIPKPVVSAIGNAASYATGNISPGENIVIFGTGVGPATLASGTIANGVFSTTAGNTRVLFDGIPAPIIYASATQTSVMVPYGINGRTTTSVVVEFTGVQSNGIAYNVVPAAPGIYTLNQQGTGPGAVLNQNGVTVNSPSTPAPRGSVIAVYMTGEGQTAPAGADGLVIPPVASALKTPLLTVTATVNGLPAKVVYYGSAPGLISGVMQVNIEIPDTAPTGGAVPLAITVGTATTQSGVTIAVGQ